MHRNKWKWKHDNPKPMGFNKSAKREVHSNTSLLQQTRETSHKNLTLHLKQIEKEEKQKLKVSRRKEIIKIREEINEKETKETIAKIKIKTSSLRRWNRQTISQTHQVKTGEESDQ